MNLHRVRGKAVTTCSVCDSFAACTVFVRSDGRELLACGDCRERIERSHSVVSEQKRLTDTRERQGRDPGVSTEL